MNNKLSNDCSSMTVVLVVICICRYLHDFLLVAVWTRFILPDIRDEGGLDCFACFWAQTLHHNWKISDKQMFLVII